MLLVSNDSQPPAIHTLRCPLPQVPGWISVSISLRKAYGHVTLKSGHKGPCGFHCSYFSLCWIALGEPEPRHDDGVRKNPALWASIPSAAMWAPRRGSPVSPPSTAALASARTAASCRAVGQGHPATPLPRSRPCRNCRVNVDCFNSLNRSIICYAKIDIQDIVFIPKVTCPALSLS